MTTQRWTSVILLASLACITWAFTSDELTKKGDEAFVAGELTKALDFYGDAINADSSNYMALFKRATLHLHKGNYRGAKYDLNQVRNLNPSFYQAWSLRGQLLFHTGEFDDARDALKKALKLKPNHKKSTKLLGQVTEAEKYLDEITTLRESGGNIQAQKEALDKLIKIAPGMSKPRLWLIEIALKSEDYSSALENSMILLKADKKNLAAVLLRGEAFKYLGEIEAAKQHFAHCLKKEPDHSGCKAAFKGLKKYIKDKEEAENLFQRRKGKPALAKVEEALNYDPNWKLIIPELNLLKCKIYNSLKDPKNAIEACNIVIEADPENSEALAQRGEAKILEEDFDGAVKDYEQAVKNSNSHEVHDGLRKAKRLLKMSLRKDYYKILGIAKSASPREIKKAFRKGALMYHPDKNSAPEAEDKFKDINEAYSVLSDPDKKGKYDRGEDLDEQQGGFGGFHGFGGGNPFQGFNFNFG